MHEALLDGEEGRSSAAATSPGGTGESIRSGEL